VWLLAGGLGWTCLTPGLAISANPAGSAAGWVVGANSDGYGLILHTTDGGAHWLRQGTPAEIPDVGLLGVSAVDRDYAWAVGANTGGYGVILRTTDGGAHWLRQGTPGEIPDVTLCDVYAVSRNIAWATGAEGVILHTADGGNTWVRQGEGVAPPVLLLGVYARDALNVWVCGATSGSCGVILHSADGGASWQRQTYTPLPDIRGTSLLHIHGNPPHTVWVVGTGTVMRSLDDGGTWESMRPPKVGGLYDCNGIDAVNANTVWLTTDQGGIYLFDGSQWQQQPSGADGYELMRVSAWDGQTAWVVGGAIGGIILFKQEGQDWTSQPFAPVVQLVDVSFPRLGARSLPAVYYLLF
jgi:photosystem II stability/assembly factor-like uncharacterized protein